MAGVASSNDTQSATSGFVPTLSSSRPVESRATASSTPPLGEPARIYQERLESRRRELLDCDRRVEMIANARLLLFVLGLVALIAAASTSFVPWWSLIPLALGFTFLVLLNGRLDRLAERARRAVAFHERGLARLEDRWTGTGPTGERYLDAAADHPYAADLDLFGNGSVFQWLCVARTRVGEQTLADWLLHPAPREVVIARQQAVAELAERLEFREDLALLGSDVRTGIEPGTLIRWAVEEPRLTQSWAPPLAALSSLATLVTLLAWMVGITGPSPFLTMALGLILFHRAFRARIAPAVESIETHARELELLAELLGRFEAETFQAPHLVTLQEKLKVEGHPPSERIARLSRLANLYANMRNALFAPLGGLLMWPLQFGFRIDAWRRESGPKVGEWLHALGELEALASLATARFENPEDPFPELVDPSQGPVFHAEGLGHPLIPRAINVRNDVNLGKPVSLMIVSGSNMSGKSTLLRSVGVAAVLAQTGGTVRARRLTLSPLVIGGTLRVQDSLQQGKSRFYAELTRVRQLVDLANGDRPLLFLLDELFSGTNSHDRRLGAEAVVRGLLDRGAIGFMTTHDLALAHLVEHLGDRAINVHFEDHLEDGKLVFDHIMKPGVVTKSNAIALMRAVGLNV